MQNFFCQEGNLGKDPDIVDIMSDSKDKSKTIKKLKLSVRFPVNKATGNGEYEDTKGFWCAVEMWGRSAEKLHGLLKKGARVLVVGSMEDNSFVASKGEREGQLISGMLVNAQYIALSPLSIDKVFYSSEKPKSEESKPSATEESNSENANVTGDVEEEIPFDS